MDRTSHELRPAVAEDAPAVAEIWYHGWRDGHLDSASPELVAERHEHSFRTRAAQRVADTTVAEIAGRIAGFVMVVGDEVEQVYVAADHRGSGVADVLLAAAERQVRDAGHATAWLAVAPANARARRFYERSGWSDGGLFEYSAEGERGRIAVPAHRYVKPL